MKQFTADPQETETAGQTDSERVTELGNQHWSRDKSQQLAKDEAIELSDEHWAVVVFLRKYYLENGLPINARETARALNQHFASQGGNRYLHKLFPEGPVTQGSRIASLRTPAYATDPSFGTSY
ncbi:MAG: TusE/DsrC/DsvC family sulfur relay protein [Gammaproteobacteria bacterium]|nr:TusE/DsrC/DsvC family sulfur relay protein [Gammaproteobacteria bacterium]